LPLRLNVFICDEILPVDDKNKGAETCLNKLFWGKKGPKFTVFQGKKKLEIMMFTV